jgi:hypothetical protein
MPQVAIFPMPYMAKTKPIVQNAIYPWRRVMAAELST